jgi:hypothetical protein
MGGGARSPVRGGRNPALPTEHSYSSGKELIEAMQNARSLVETV